MSNDNWILYDGECPFCKNYVKLLQLKDSVGPVRIVNARESSPELQKAKDKNLDLNLGMVFSYNGQLYHGDQAVNALALLGESKGVFNRLNKWIFSSKSRSNFFYPALRAGRNCALKFKGKPQISQTE